MLLARVFLRFDPIRFVLSICFRFSRWRRSEFWRSL